MNVKEIVEKYLKENGYDGLFHEGDCGCEVGDLAPCDGSALDCEPGYKIDGCSSECGAGCEFHFGPKKPGGK